MTNTFRCPKCRADDQLWEGVYGWRSIDRFGRPSDYDSADEVVPDGRVGWPGGPEAVGGPGAPGLRKGAARQVGVT